MTSQVQKKQSLIPDYPRDLHLVDSNGNINPQWNLALSSLFQSLQKLFTSEGFGLPALNQEDQDNIEATYQNYINQSLPPGVPDISGQRIIDSSDINPRVPKVFIIEYNSNKTVSSAAWKSYTIT